MLSGIQQPLTVGELAGPRGPFLVEVLMTRGTYAGSHERQWVLVQSVRDADEGLRVAARMSQAYQYRLYISPDMGYLYLDWQDGEGDECNPAWVRR